MKKIEKTISIEDFRRLHTQKIKENVSKEVQKAFDTIPANLLNRDKLKYLFYIGIGFIVIGILIFVLAIYLKLMSNNVLKGLGITIIIIGLIVGFIGRSPEKEINKHIKRTVNENQIYADIFDTFEDIHFLTISSGLMKSLKSKRGDFSIPTKAIPKIASPIISIKYKEKYEVSFQNVQWYWTEKVNKTTTTFVKWMGIFEINANDDKLLKDFEFTLNKSNFLFGLDNLNSKIKLENSVFVKKLKPRANNEIKARQIFTPLAMENLINYPQTLPITYWYLEKQNNIVFLPYTTNYQNVLILNFSSKSRNVKIITDQITEDIIKDCYFMYSILAITKKMPLL